MPRFTHRIPPEYVGPSGEISLGGLARLFQRTATLHSSEMGFTSEWYDEHQCGWVSRRSTIDWKEPLYQDQSVQVKTWIDDVRLARSMRIYEVYFEESLLARGWTDWIHIDRTDNSIKKIPDEIEKKLLTSGSGEFSPKRDTLDVPDVPSEAMEANHGVTFRDLDEQGHANNTVYHDYLEETYMQYLSKNEYTDTKIRNWGPIRFDELTLKYLDETLWGDRLTGYLWSEEENSDNPLFYFSLIDDFKNEIISEARFRPRISGY